MTLDPEIFTATRDRYQTCETRLAAQIAALSADDARRPDFMIIGAPRSGTTFLVDLLRSARQIHIPDEKELKFFSANLVSWDLEAYLNHFRAGVGRVVGEGTPTYASLPPSRIELIRKLSPSLKVVYLLRDPRERLASAWKHASGGRADWSEHDLVTYVASDGPTVACDYAANLERWLGVFPAGQIRVCCYEVLRRDPKRVLDDVLAFLGVDDRQAGRDRLERRHNETGEDPEVDRLIGRIAGHLLGARTARLKPLLDRHFPATEQAEWVGGFAAPAAPAAIHLYDLAPGLSVWVTAGGEYLCGPCEAIERLRDGAGADLDRYRRAGVGVGRYLSEAIGHYVVIENLAGRRLHALCHGDQWDDDLFLVRENYFGWNVVSYRRRFYAIRTLCGEVDLRSLASRRLAELVGLGYLAEFATLDAALEYSAGLWNFVSSQSA